MKKALKISAIVLLCLFTAICIGSTVYLLCVPSVPLNNDFLNRMDRVTLYLDQTGNKIIGNVTGKNGSYVALTDLSETTKNAFICTEDKRFYTHKGVDYNRMLAAAFKNIVSSSPAQGASTITQQLAKNTHLTADKTLTRKIQEIRLAKQIEQQYNKDEILEMYLNVVYFGHNLYGIESASRSFFNQSASSLSVAQAATLAAVINAPAYYSPRLHPDACLKRRNLVLKNMVNQGKISQSEYQTALNEKIVLTKTITQPADYYLTAARKEAASILGSQPNGCVVYTSYSPSAQTVLSRHIVSSEEYLTKAVLRDDKGNITAACGDLATIGSKRQPGSVIKPLVAYAPAIERGMLSPATPICDEPIDFGGYSPKNYGGTYQGWISARQALAHSNNIAAVKTLNMIGTDYAYDFASNLGLTLSQKDKRLPLALGGLTYGVTLEELTGAYHAFASGGTTDHAGYVQKIVDAKGKVLYQRQSHTLPVMSNDTAAIITDILKTCAVSGTASKLGSLPYDVAAKTGTVGYKNTEYNTDAYCISYTAEHTLGVWYGARDTKEEKALPTTLRGGTLPTQQTRSIYSDLYRNYQPKNFDYSLETIKIDKNLYERDHKIVAAPYFMPDSETITEKFGLRYRPETARLIKPLLTAKVKDGDVVLTVTGDTYADCQIIRYGMHDVKKIPIGRLTNSTQTVVDREAKKGKLLMYKLLAMYPDGSSVLSDMIKVIV